MSKNNRPESRNKFEIAIISALTIERDAVEALLDEDYEEDGFSYGKAPGDPNIYTIGRLGNQNVVLAYLPGMGTISAAAVAASLTSSFRGVRVAFLVGICGGVPTTPERKDIFLGDVIISHSVVQIDFGRQYPDGFVRKEGVEDTLGQASPEVRAFVGKISGYRLRKTITSEVKAISTGLCSKDEFAQLSCPGPVNDVLYSAEHRHKHWFQSCTICDSCKDQNDRVCESALQGSCRQNGCDASSETKLNRIQRMVKNELIEESPPGSWELSQSDADSHVALNPSVHFGRLACGNRVIRSGFHRDHIACEEKIIGFEMESAGICDYIPTIVIKGVCDYADSHKNKRWQKYAAVTAAACAKAVLKVWRTTEMPAEAVAVQKSPNPVPQKNPVYWTITRVRNPLFTGRDVILHDMETTIKNALSNVSNSERCWIVISGLGGQGKSEICLNLAHRLRSLFWGMFWIDVSTTSLAENGFLNLGTQLKITPQGWEDVRQHLANTKQSWLLILDNADDPSIDYQQYFPDGPSSVIILTSRNPECKEYATSPGSGLVLEGLSISDAQKLLLHNTDAPDQKKSLEGDAYDVAQLLRSHPLALIQARAYIMKGHCTMRDYPKIYERQRQRLLTHRPSQARSRYQDVYATFEASAEIIESLKTQCGSDALQLLSILAFCGPNRFPLTLFKAAYDGAREVFESESKSDSEFEFADHDDDPEQLTPWHLRHLPSFIQANADEWDQSRVIEAIDLLKTFSLVTTDTHSGFVSISLHPLVHAWAKDRLGEESQNQTWVVTGCLLAFSTDDDVWWKHMRQLQAHLQAFMSWDIKRMFRLDPPEMVCRILVKVGSQLSDMRRDQELFEFLTKLLTHLNLEWLKVDSQWLELYSLAADNLIDREKTGDAIVVLEQLVQIRKQTLPESHNSRLASLEQLAGAYEENDQIEEAISLLEHVVQIRKQTLLENDADRLRAQRTLAKAYIVNGQTREAITLLEHVVQIEGRVLAEDHHSLLTSQHELARVYKDNGQIQESISLLKHVVQMGSRTLPEEHPDQLMSQYELTEAYYENWQISECISLLEHMVQVAGRALPEGNLNRLAYEFELATVYEENGQIQEAIRLYQNIIRIHEQVSPEDDGDLLNYQHSLARAYVTNHQVQEAVVLLKHVVQKAQKLAQNDPARLICEHELARAYWADGQREEATVILERVVQIREQTYERTDRERLISEYLLATYRWRSGNRESATNLMEQVVNALQEAPDQYYDFRDGAQNWLRSMKAKAGESPQTSLVGATGDARGTGKIVASTGAGTTDGPAKEAEESLLDRFKRLRFQKDGGSDRREHRHV